VTPEAPAPRAPSPIADLSYRTYDGPLRARSFRWWTIAVAGIRLALRKKGFWPLLALASFQWVVVGVLVYIRVMTGGAADIMGPGGASSSYAQDFFRAASGQTLWLFLLTLLVGAGAIAADNGANALLVYLAKPITKADYLIGKWMGVFLVIFAAAFVPALLLYVYCAGFYAGKGFFREDPWLILRIVGAAAVPAVVNASVMLGISAWCRTARVAGTAYAALYFVSAALTRIVLLARFGNDPRHTADAAAFSIGGLIDGLMQSIYGVAQKTVTFGHRGPRITDVPPPDIRLLLAIAAVLVIAGLAAARIRIRAVEVVRG
jgi:ABC-2 type transport system permease protein